MADGAEVHVGIEVAGGEEAVGDEVDEVPPGATTSPPPLPLGAQAGFFALRNWI